MISLKPIKALLTILENGNFFKGFYVMGICQKYRNFKPNIVILACGSTSVHVTSDLFAFEQVSFNAAVECLPALHYSVDFIFLSFGIMGFIVEL